MRRAGRGRRGPAPPREVHLSGLTRYQIGVLLEIYNRHILDSEKGCGTPVDAMKFVVALFGIGISTDEAQRIITVFGGKKATKLTFNQFMDFFEWFVSEKKIMMLYQAAESGITEAGIREGTERTLSNTALGFVKAVKDMSQLPEGEEARSMFMLYNVLPTLGMGCDVSKGNTSIDIKFQLTIGNLVGASFFEYFGLDSDALSLNFFLRVECCGEEYTTKVFPAKETPSMRESFVFRIQSSRNQPLSFLDATHWLQHHKVRIRVYGVHFIDVKVAYHLLGVAKIPLVALLSGRAQRVSFAVNVEPITPYLPMRLLMAVTGDEKFNEIATHSQPLECVLLEKYFPWIKKKMAEREQTKAWERAMTGFSQAIEKFPAREYQVFGTSEYNEPYFLPEFVNTWDAGKLDGVSVKELIYYISLHSDSVFSYDNPSLLQIRSLATVDASQVRMSQMERAILLCSILRSKKVKAFVCIGDCHWQRYICVVCETSEAWQSVFESVDCVNHIYSADVFHARQSHGSVPSVDERILGQEHIMFSNLVNPIYFAMGPVRDDLCATCELDGPQRIDWNDKYILVPVSGWHRDAPPEGFQVATVFNEQKTYLYTGRHRNAADVNWKGIFEEKGDRSDWLCATSLDESRASVYDFVNFLGWLSKPRSKADLWRINTRLLMVVWKYALSSGPLPTRVKCLKRLQSCLLRLLKKEEQQTIIRLRHFADVVAPMLHASDPDVKRAQKELAIVNELIRMNYEKENIIGVNFALYATVIWLSRKLEQEKRSDDKPQHQEVEYAKWEKYVLESCKSTAPIVPSVAKAVVENDITDFVNSWLADRATGKRDVLLKDFMLILRNGRRLYDGQLDALVQNSKFECKPYEKDMVGFKPHLAKMTIDLINGFLKNCSLSKKAYASVIWARLWKQGALASQLIPQQKGSSKPAETSPEQLLSAIHNHHNHGTVTEVSVRLDEFKKCLASWENDEKCTTSIWDFIDFPMPIIIGYQILAGLVLSKQQQATEGRECMIPGFYPPTVETLVFMRSEVQVVLTKKIIDKLKKDANGPEAKKVTVHQWEFDMIEFAQEIMEAQNPPNPKPAHWDASYEVAKSCIEKSEKLLEKVTSLVEISGIELAADLLVSGLETTKSVCDLLVPRIEALGICVDVKKCFVHTRIPKLGKNADMYPWLLAAFGTYYEASTWWTPPDTETQTYPVGDVELDLFYHHLRTFLHMSLIDLESEFIENGRIVGGPDSTYERIRRAVEFTAGLLQDQNMSSVHQARFSFRLTKHKTADPGVIADELMQSGIMTSALGCESIFLIVQPFRYMLHAESSWVAVVFLYPIPVADPSDQGGAF